MCVHGFELALWAQTRASLPAKNNHERNARMLVHLCGTFQALSGFGGCFPDHLSCFPELRYSGRYVNLVLWTVGCSWWMSKSCRPQRSKRQRSKLFGDMLQWRSEYHNPPFWPTQERTICTIFWSILQAYSYTVFLLQFLHSEGIVLLSIIYDGQPHLEKIKNKCSGCPDL